jgi:hypothetical protein
MIPCGTFAFSRWQTLPVYVKANDIIHLLKTKSGDVAQLGERRVRNAKVGSSILLVSTISFF